MTPAPTFASAKDRLVWVVTEAQWLVVSVLVFLGLVIGLAQPSIPGAPGWVTDFLAALLILGPPLFLAGVRFAKWLRVRNWVQVHHINSIEDTVEKYNVPPDVWKDKTVEGADPWPVNGGSAWAVRQFEWIEGTEDLVVEGVYLSELSDDKLLTSKRHMKEIHGSLLEKYLELSSLRDRLGRMGVEAQEALANAGAEAREQGQLTDPKAVQNVYEDAKQDAEDLGTDDLPTIEDVEDDIEEIGTEPEPEQGAGGDHAAADGGAPTDG